MCMRPWIRRYRFYWTFAPGWRLNYEAYLQCRHKVLNYYWRCSHSNKIFVNVDISRVLARFVVAAEAEQAWQRLTNPLMRQNP